MKSRNYSFGIWGQHILSVLVWLAVAAAVAMLFRYQAQRFEILGFAQGRIHQISAPVDSRLKIISVELFENVSRGQTLTVLDDTQLNAQIATIHAEIEHLTSLLLSTRDTMLAEAANLQTDSIAAQRRFYIDVENARLRILELKTLLEPDRIMLEDLALEVEIVQELVDKKAVTVYQLQKAQVQYNTLAKRIKENEIMLQQAQQDLEKARQRRGEFAQRLPVHPSVDAALDEIRKQIAVQEKLITQLSVQRQALTIKSPVDGIVIQIQVNANQAPLRRPGEDVLRRPGEVVLAGDPILAIAETEPVEIIAYVAEEQSGQIQERMKVELIKHSEPVQIANSQVMHLGPSLEMMPQRLWRNPNIPQWGRPMLIKIPPSLKLIPGELVGIRLQ